jgi:hypothetical protein
MMRLARQSFYFGRPVRGVLGDFSVLIAISVAAGVKFLFFPDVFVRVRKFKLFNNISQVCLASRYALDIFIYVRG